jgi:hypothetical protein
MKKTISSLFIMGGLISVAALAGCGTSTSSDDLFGCRYFRCRYFRRGHFGSSALQKHLQLVPSNDPAKLLTLATQQTLP